jgi:drug/metabolite transporter (DMT)-like permease
MKPRHDPIADSDFRFLDGIACAMLAIAIWSVVGVIAGWWLHHSPTIWLFTWALVVSGGVLLAIGYVEGRSS